MNTSDDTIRLSYRELHDLGVRFVDLPEGTTRVGFMTHVGLDGHTTKVMIVNGDREAEIIETEPVRAEEVRMHAAALARKHPL
jgi:hypothetical protein